MANEVVAQAKQESAAQEQTRPGRTFVPNVDIRETADALWLWADVPGVDEKSIDVRLENGRLSLEGRVSAADYENLSPVYTEYNVGDFVRSFRISDAIDAERVRAKVTDGVLELELPKAASARPRRIPVTSGS
jgi:HSP20 family molecular chaperone IbpA